MVFRCAPIQCIIIDGIPIEEMKECQPTSCLYERKESMVRERYLRASSQMTALAMTAQFHPGARMEKLTFLDQVRQSSHAAFP